MYRLKLKSEAQRHQSPPKLEFACTAVCNLSNVNDLQSRLDGLLTTPGDKEDFLYQLELWACLNKLAIVSGILCEDNKSNQFFLDAKEQMHVLQKIFIQAPPHNKYEILRKLIAYCEVEAELCENRGDYNGETYQLEFALGFTDLYSCDDDEVYLHMEKVYRARADIHFRLAQAVALFVKQGVAHERAAMNAQEAIVHIGRMPFASIQADDWRLLANCHEFLGKHYDKQGEPVLANQAYEKAVQAVMNIVIDKHTREDKANLLNLKKSAKAAEEKARGAAAARRHYGLHAKKSKTGSCYVPEVDDVSKPAAHLSS